MAYKRRSGEAMAALGRKAGPMGHRLQPRGGAKNDQPELLEEAAQEASLIDELVEEAEARELEHRRMYAKWQDPYDDNAADIWSEIVTWLKGKR